MSDSIHWVLSRKRRLYQHLSWTFATQKGWMVAISFDTRVIKVKVDMVILEKRSVTYVHSKTCVLFALAMPVSRTDSSSLGFNTV